MKQPYCTMGECEYCGFKTTTHTVYDEPTNTRKRSCDYCLSKTRPELFQSEQLSKIPCSACGSKLFVIQHHLSYRNNTTVPLCAKCHRAAHKNNTRPDDSPRCSLCGKLMFWRKSLDGWACKNWECKNYCKYGYGVVIKNDGTILNFKFKHVIQCYYDQQKLEDEYNFAKEISKKGELTYDWFN